MKSCISLPYIEVTASSVAVLWAAEVDLNLEGILRLERLNYYYQKNDL